MRFAISFFRHLCLSFSPSHSGLFLWAPRSESLIALMPKAIATNKLVFPNTHRMHARRRATKLEEWTVRLIAATKEQSIRSFGSVFFIFLLSSASGLQMVISTVETVLDGRTEPDTPIAIAAYRPSQMATRSDQFVLL